MKYILDHIDPVIQQFFHYPTWRASEHLVQQFPASAGQMKVSGFAQDAHNKAVILDFITLYRWYCVHFLYVLIAWTTQTIVLSL